LVRDQLAKPVPVVNDKYTRKYRATLQLKNFESLLKLIQDHPAIQIILIRLPMHPKVYLEQDAYYFELVNQLTRYSNTRFIDFHQSMNIPDSSFADSTHLNYKGARLFTPFFKAKLQAL
jgi:hypothetical protein